MSTRNRKAPDSTARSTRTGKCNCESEQIRCVVAGQDFAARTFVFAESEVGLRGFTLLELMIVISIIMILMAVAVPMYNQSIVQARESVLRSNLQHTALRHFSIHARQTEGSAIARRNRECWLSAADPVDPMTRANQLGSGAGRRDDGGRPARPGNHGRALGLECDGQ